MSHYLEYVQLVVFVLQSLLDSADDPLLSLYVGHHF